MYACFFTCVFSAALQLMVSTFWKSASARIPLTMFCLGGDLCSEFLLLELHSSASQALRKTLLALFAILCPSWFLTGDMILRLCGIASSFLHLMLKMWCLYLVCLCSNFLYPCTSFCVSSSYVSHQFSRECSQLAWS